MKAAAARIATIVLLVGALVFAAWSPAHAEDMTCPAPLPVTIDIKPGSIQNPISLSAQGLLPVAVLSTPTFNASQFIPEMAHLADAASPMAGTCAGAMAVRWAWTDVNRDKLPDLVFFFRTQDVGLTLDSTAATLMAHGTVQGVETHITGTDSVTITP